MAQNLLFAEESLVCPDCKGRLVPLKAKDSEHFAICDMCGNGYNTNYSPPAIYYTEKNKPVGYISQMQKVEDRKEMIKEINEQGFIKQNDDTIYTYWTHYGKKKNSLRDIEALLHDSFYGLIVQEEETSHTWIITKEFFEHIKSTYFFEKVKDKNKWTNPYTTDLNKLRELFDSKAKLYKTYYEKAHFLRWGTNGEEYSNV